MWSIYTLFITLLAGPRPERIIADCNDGYELVRRADLEGWARRLLWEGNGGDQEALIEIYDLARELRLESLTLELQFYPDDSCDMAFAVVDGWAAAFVLAIGTAPKSTANFQARLVVARTGPDLAGSHLYHLGWVCLDTPGDVMTRA